MKGINLLFNISRTIQVLLLPLMVWLKVDYDIPIWYCLLLMFLLAGLNMFCVEYPPKNLVEERRFKLKKLKKFLK